MKTKIVTIGQVAVACFKTKIEMESWQHGGDGPTGPLYAGRAASAPHVKVVQLHPDFADYYANALAVKWQGRRELRSGTESAKMAFFDTVPVGTKFVVIWHPITHEKE